MFQIENCSTFHLRLKLIDIDFPDAKLMFNLDTNEVLIYKLELVFTETAELQFQPNGFNNLAFSNLAELTIENVKTDKIPKKAFIGLLNLCELSFLNASVEVWEDGVLDCCNETLSELILHQKYDVTSSARSIKPLTGTTTMKALTSIKIRDNLGESINYATFIGLKEIVSLNLSHCQIESIGPQSFYSIESTLQILDLSGNKLQHLPDLLFPSIADNQYQIYLSSNPWDCDCGLIEFENEFRKKSLLKDLMECASPYCRENTYISEAIPCTQMNISPCEQNPQLPESPIGPPTHPGGGGGSLLPLAMQECFDESTNECENVLIQGQTKLKEVIIDEKGVVTIEIDVDTYSRNWVIIWFHTNMEKDGPHEYYESSDEIVCQSSDTAVFTIRNLTHNTAYTICLVDKGETTISPLDCMPYYFQVTDPNDDDAPWILEEDKVKVISFVACGGIVSIILGVFLSYILIRSNPTWLRGNKRIVRVANSTNSDVMIMPPEWRKESSSSNKKEYFFFSINVVIYIIIFFSI